MNVILIFPSFPDTFWNFRKALNLTGRKAMQPPLGLLTIASMLPDSWNLKLVDLNVRKLTDTDLKWADINWAESTIRVEGKSRREDLLPLPQDVGDAILHYVEHMRPATSSDRVFIIATAPYTPIRVRQVSQTAQRALLRAGVQTSSYGAHIFRHSVATTMLRGGASLGEIGRLLRHADEDTTKAYAKVDVELLRQVALPWPEEVSQC